MPNWCSNELNVTGDTLAIEDFLDKSRSVPEYYDIQECDSDEEIVDMFSFSGCVPIPEDIYNGDHTISWNRKNWGTKWDIGPVILSSEYFELDWTSEESVHINFSTADNPPTKWLETVSSMFPSLKFHLRYSEPGNGIAGYAEAANGIMKHTQHSMS